jgi:TonB-linked SusC/RagA family outer membrane protein
LTQSLDNVLNTNLTGIITYDTSFGGIHNVNALIGVTREVFKGSDFSTYRRYFISSAIEQLLAGSTDLQNTDGSGYERARLGYFGRAQYDFKQKYLLEFIFRYDGSYIFPEDKRFGFFPGFLAGWNISNEDFFKVGWINYLKLRASYGTMGNDIVTIWNPDLKQYIFQEYAYLSSYEFGNYPINRSVQTTLVETVIPNLDFTWEIARNFNLGLDASLFNNQFDVSLEYFLNKREDILIQKTGSIPATSGLSGLLPPVNAGKVDNTGFEISLLYSNKKSTVRWNAGINAGYAKNKVVYMDEIPGAPDYQRQEGKPMGAWMVYIYDGVFKDVEEIASNSIDYSGVKAHLMPGDMKFKDIDGNGIIDGNDKVRMDKSQEPTWNYGATFNLNWKGFDFSMLLQGAAGHSNYIATSSNFAGNYLKYDYDNRWSIDNPSDQHPRIARRGDTYYTSSHSNVDYFLHDRKYLRLKNIEIGYNVPMGRQNVVQRFRVYLRGFNVATIAANRIYDPESINEAGTYYPQARIITSGLSITF